MIATKNLHRLEDGPTGGTPLYFGNDMIGQAIEANLPSSGGWNLARIADLSLAQAAYQLAVEKRLWLPTMNKSDAVAVPMTTVENIGDIGPIHRDINGKMPNGEARGPFDIVPTKPGSASTYPALWSHDAVRERAMSFEGDSEGIPRHGKTADEQTALGLKVTSVWNTASHCHFNCDFQFNSQSTSMQFTPRKTIGGRAWLSIRMPSVEHEKAVVLFGNTSLGLLLRWWHSNRQQSGRGNMGKSVLQTLPVIDVTALKPKQLAAAAALFDAMSGRQLLPLHEIDSDVARRELDEKFARNVIGLPRPLFSSGGPLELLRMKLAREPSIRGNK